MDADVRLRSFIGHHAVYEAAHILHRDVSVNNIMFHRVENSKVIGVMCDWDLAKVINASDIAIDSIVNDTAKSEIPPETSKKTSSASLAKDQPTTQHAAAAVDGQHPQGQRNFRTGTGPFMALDLLIYEQVPYHLYRHDLESFFYALVWFIGMYDPKTRTLGHIEEWLKGTFKNVGKNKAEAVRKMVPIESIMMGGHASYTAFAPRAMNILRRLVVPTLKAYNSMQDSIAMAITKVPWAERGLLSQEQKTALVIEDIHSEVVAREKIMSYEAFMDCLEVPAEEV